MAINRASSSPKEDVWLKTVCHGCLNGVCGLLVHRVNGTVVGLKGDPDSPFNRGKLCAKAFSQILTMYEANRPAKPLIRTNPEKGIGVDPGWKEVSWDEAFNLAAKKLAEIRQKDPNDLILSLGDVSAFPWVPAVVIYSFGSSNFTSPATYYCASAVHSPPHMAMGCFNTYPDWEYVNHVVLWGSNKGGMLQHLGVTAALDVAEARMKRGMKLVCIDPVQSNIGSKANEWVPILPGTDLALALAWLNVLLNETSLYDEECLKIFTNAPYLVKNDGHYLREVGTGKPLMWDRAEGAAKPFDATFADVAIEGNYQIEGVICRPAFQRLKEHAGKYSPEWAAEITGVPAATIRHLATDFGEAARIGSTIKYEGHTLPYRPAAMHWYAGLSQHTNGFLTGFAVMLINTVVGNLMVPGGMAAEATVVEFPVEPRSEKSGKNGWPEESSEGLIVPSTFIGARLRTTYPAAPVTPPKSHRVDELYPLNMIGCAPLEINALHPETYNHKVPRSKMFIGRHASDVTNRGNPQEVAERLKPLFQISCEPFIDETAEFADIFFPVPTALERLLVGRGIHGRLGATLGLADHCVPGCQPVVRDEAIVGKEMLDIWTEVAERAGFLPDVNRVINMSWDLPEGYRLDLDKKYTHKEVQEKVASGVYGHSLEHYSKEALIKWRKSVQERYPRAFFRARAPIYFEHFVDAGRDVAKVCEDLGIDALDVSHYEPIPSWHADSAATGTRPGFDLVAIPFRLPFLSHMWQTHNPMLAELAEHHPWGLNIILNAQTATERGIKDGDHVVVEAVTGYKEDGTVKLTQCIHPNVVALSRHGGHWASRHDVSKGKGTLFNTLIPHNLEYMDPVYTGLSACVSVRVFKAATR